ncbi:MAG: hypothetical protein KDA50_11585 [Rhodobacteraceae bacterium]|nr:hypothetical protein [Paracoccaceae bacterium]
MTVLTKYERLECPGLWHPAPDAQRQNVFVSLGEATLIIRDSTDTALAHWSLPAIERVNPGKVPALYRPGPDAEELLELEDDMMIDAIRTVRRAVAKAQPKRGRVRRAVFLGTAVAVALLGALWLPGALVRHTAQVLPETVRQEVGQRLLRKLAPYTGTPCGASNGIDALAQLQDRVLGPAPWNVVVVPDGPVLSAGLPGGMLLLRKDLIEGADGPEAAAGALLTEAARSLEQDPLLGLLETVGPGATLRLLTQGEIADDNLDRAAKGYLLHPPAEMSSASLAARFSEAGVPPGPYAARAGVVIPLAPQPYLTPLLPDAIWLRLSQICSG